MVSEEAVHVRGRCRRHQKTGQRGGMTVYYTEMRGIMGRGINVQGEETGTQDGFQMRVQEEGQLPEMPGEQDKSPQQELSLEQAFEQIEEVIAGLEAEEITLEESFRAYNRGMKLLQHCNETIDRVEKKVMQINEEGGLDEF